MNQKRTQRMSLLLVMMGLFAADVTAAEAASKRIWNVPVYGQYPELPAGCEATAVAMLLNWAGAGVTKTGVADAIAREPLHYRSNGRLLGGDPELGFIGNPYVKEGSFGVFAKPMVDVIDRYLPGRGVDLTGSTLSGLLTLIDQGHPVAAWVSNKLEMPKENARWHTAAGKQVIWRSPEHVMAIIGYNDQQIIVNDGADGTVRHYPRDQFEAVYNAMGRHALTIARYPQPKFSVYQYNTWLRDFPSLNEAIAFAKRWDHSKVEEKATKLLRWDNWPGAVYQYDKHLGSFPSRLEAIAYAQQYAHSRVIDLTTGKLGWDNWPNYVYQGERLIKEFPAIETHWAIEYAKGYADSRVVDGGSGAVVWSWPK